MVKDNNWVQQRAARERRERIVDALGTFIEERGYPPTRAELAKAVGMADSTLRHQLAILIEEGRIVDHGGHRALALPS